eukprot:15070701-Ditylum_brightwellii.AAC.1
MGLLPTDKEMQTSILQLNNTATSKSDIKTEIYKALVTDNNTFNTIKGFIHVFCKGEQQPSKFDISNLGVLPKQGDIYLPGNYR